DLEKALERAAGIENLEERLVPGAVDPVVLDFLEQLAAAAG
ncbi:MAG: fimbrial assembly protein FimA, partial [Actinomycetota bacterium]